MAPDTLRQAASEVFRTSLTIAAITVGLSLPAFAQESASAPDSADESTARKVLSFLGGAATGLAAHEGGHLLFAAILDADPSLKRVELAGLPFFALTHRSGLSPRPEFVVSAAGFWMQHATSEILLTRHPRLRDERAPFKKGLMAFNVLTSVGYSVAAVAKAGPYERDTRAIADGVEISERWVGIMVLVPAVLDAYRYFKPESRWATWSSRVLKVGWVALVIK